MKQILLLTFSSGWLLLRCCSAESKDDNVQKPALDSHLALEASVIEGYRLGGFIPRIQDIEIWRAQAKKEREQLSALSVAPPSPAQLSLISDLGRSLAEERSAKLAARTQNESVPFSEVFVIRRNAILRRTEILKAFSGGARTNTIASTADTIDADSRAKAATIFKSEHKVPVIKEEVRK